MSALIARECDTVTIRLEHDCGRSHHCAELAAQLHQQLHRAYRFPASILELPEDVDDHLATHRTFRKRAARARRLGYSFAPIDRTRYVDDIYEINTSAPERQGRPMSAGYLERPAYSPLPDYPCDRHAIRTYGVVDAENRLRAYTWVYRVGDLVMFSTILGHAEHMPSDVMYLLVEGVLRAEAANGPGVCFYNLHNSGTDGLRFFKERVGFRAATVDWVLA